MELQEELKLHPLLTQIVPEEYPAERFQRLWENLSTQEYALDDLVKADPAIFVANFAFPSNLFWEIGDLQGLVCAMGVQARLDAELHFAVWGQMKITDLMQAGRSLQEYLFETYALNRLSASIPNQNSNARRLAKLLWFTDEGLRRKAFLSNGNYSDVVLMGLLHSEFKRFKREGM